MEQTTAPDMLASITPMIRGLLAEPAGDPDTPYQPVILRTLDDRETINFLAGFESADVKEYSAPLRGMKRPPWVVDPPDTHPIAPTYREKLAEALAGYAAEHGTKPQAIAVRDTGVLYMIEPDSRATDLPLSGRVAVVTGAAGAIGHGICAGLLEQGCYVAATDLPGERLNAFVGELAEEVGDRVIGVPMDVTSALSMGRGFDRVAQTWGGVDVVVINAGIAHVAALTELDLEAFQRLERVNVEGTLLTIAEAGRVLSSQGIGGDIVLVSTKNVFAPGARFGAYSATKAASHQLARIASLELAEFGIRVNMVAPDGVFSDGKQKSGLWAAVGPDRMKARGLDEAGLEEYYRGRNLLKARITARHVANAVLFFVTHQTPTTGATIPVDGGLPDATPR